MKNKSLTLALSAILAITMINTASAYPRVNCNVVTNKCFWYGGPICHIWDEFCAGNVHSDEIDMVGKENDVI